jgi:dihydroflavonol-4-reductase
VPEAKAEANHVVVTPQLGFQWFPVRTRGLSLLPWAGVQLPVAGTREVETPEGRRDSRRVMAVITAHVGWAF